MKEQDTHTMEQHLSDRLRDYERANAELRAELNQIKTILADPNAVRLNMLRGTIAWTPETLRGVLGEPVPEPTKEELEWMEFEAVFRAKYPEIDFSGDFGQGAFDGWKAARAGR